MENELRKALDFMRGEQLAHTWMLRELLKMQPESAARLHAGHLRYMQSEAVLDFTEAEERGFKSAFATIVQPPA